MRNLLQEQLLKAGLAKKSKVDEAAREMAKKRKVQAAPDDAERIDARQLQAERAERDRALAAERNAQARLSEIQAQVRQIVDANKVKREGEIAYAFNDGEAIRRLFVDAAQRALLAKGALVIARHHDAYELLPRAAADKVMTRDPSAIVLDHGRNAVTEAAAEPTDDDAYYARFKVPDDLIW
jgi:uncharacterized protein YaiL (DUF2058 family)